MSVVLLGILRVEFVGGWYPHLAVRRVPSNGFALDAEFVVGSHAAGFSVVAL